VKCPDVETHKFRLRDLTYESAFETAICVDAMEDVSLEDRPIVPAATPSDARPGGQLHL